MASTPFEPYAHRCRVCGMQSPLSYEHVPPKSAGNDERAEMFRLLDYLAPKRGEKVRGTIRQRGTGYQTLCVPCNTRTGAWYVPELQKWVEVGTPHP